MYVTFPKSSSKDLEKQTFAFMSAEMAQKPFLHIDERLRERFLGSLQVDFGNAL